MRSGIASPENVTEASGIASPTSSHCLTALARAKLLFFLIQCELLDVVGPVELWATRWRRPSAAANPQGFCWPATPPLTHFVARVMLVRPIRCPADENRPGAIKPGFGCRSAELRVAGADVVCSV